MNKRSWLMVIILCLYLGGLYYSSSLPYEEQDIRGSIRKHVNLEEVEKKFSGLQFFYGSKTISIDELGSDAYVEFFVRKGAHVATFAGLTAVLYALLRCWFTPAAAMPWSGFLSLGCAVLDEFHQSFTPNRTGQMLDVILDSTGIILSLLLILIWNSLRRKRLR